MRSGTPLTNGQDQLGRLQIRAAPRKAWLPLQHLPGATPSSGEHSSHSIRMWISKDTETEEESDSCLYPSDLEVSPLATAGGGSYQPAVGLAAARALRFVPYGEAVSAVRALQGASHEDLRLRVHELSSSLNGVFFNGGTEPEKAPPFAAGARFPEGALLVCADRAPLSPALRDATRAMMQVAVEDASHGPCDCYYDVVRALMLLLVGDEGRPAPEVVFCRETFESALALQWVVPAADAVGDDAVL